MKAFQDEVAIVTGAASGIGRALCEELGRRGARIVMVDVDAAGVESSAAEMVRRGVQAVALTVDVADARAVQRLVDDTVQRFGRLDLMVNNAGVGIAGEVRDLGLDHWRRVVDINLWGTIAGTQAAYAVMLRQGHGHIVNVASLGGLIPFPSSVPYAATKHAVVGLSQSLRWEAMKFGIRVSAVCPAFVQSGIYRNSVMVNAQRDKVVAAIPFKLVPAPVAASKILDGVARNRAIIVFPWYGRLFWWLYRLHPVMLAPMLRRMILDFRAARG